MTPSEAEPGATRAARTPISGGAGAIASPKDTAETSGAISVPKIILPSGGGAINGIGEKFSANPVTGTGSLSVPIYTSPGRSGFGPQLSLSYDSGSGNGPFGFGWSLSLPSISRKTDRGLPKYQDEVESDVFILSGAEDLVPVFEKGDDGSWMRNPSGRIATDEHERDGYLVRRYRPRVEGLFAVIERWTRKTDGDTHWRSISKENILTVYGRDRNSRIADPNGENRVFRWLICESYDDKGNAVVYEYAPENDQSIDFSQASESNRHRTSNRYVKRIWYGNRKPLLLDTSEPGFRRPHTKPQDFSTAGWMFEVVFDYDEDHYDVLPLDTSIPEVEQHHLAQASALASGVWSSRPDPFSSFKSRFEVRTHRRCHRVLMFHIFPELGSEPYLVRSTDFDYSDFDYSQPFRVETELAHEGSTRLASFIRRVTQSGYILDETRQPVARDGVTFLTYFMKSLPPLEFRYSSATIHEDIEEVTPESIENLPSGVDGSRYQWVDLDGESLSGILMEREGSWFYKPNRGYGNFGPLEKVSERPSLADLAAGRQHLLDVAGDGQLDLVQFEGPVPGFYERTEDQNWENLVPFPTLPNISWRDPNLRFVDLDGDGHSEVLITEEEVLRWYPSLAAKGFANVETVREPPTEELGPRLVFNDGTQSIYLADMSGDGLSDLVRIRNGEVAYWPNLGYGYFGAKVTMDNSPLFDAPDQFDQKRIRLADIHGSGTTDVLYLGRESVQVYFNQSGNRWSNAKTLSSFPHTDRLSSVQVTNLLGTGTACLVWSSPLVPDSRRPMRYIDLLGGQKPHLLVSSKNNLGAETRLRYAASTKFYLADKAAGRPWITRLPFPVHVVERVETYDFISRNRFVTRYAYHHGYFDGIEREFRGFGMLEQWDTEEIGNADNDTLGSEDVNWDARSYVPPVLTRTWFHLGALLGENRISKCFEEEYYHEGDPNMGEGPLSEVELEAMLLPDTAMPDGLAAEETGEASRSLKGQILRQEVYALDRLADGAFTEESRRPYAVSERNYTVEPVQPIGENRHAVFFVHPRETVDYHYERRLVSVGPGKQADPRVSHKIILQVDRFGNVERLVTIGYPRRNVPDTKTEQTETNIILTASRFANSSENQDWYRVGLPAETQTYEIVKPPEPVTSATSVALLRFEDIRRLIEGLFPSNQDEPNPAKTLPYEKWDWRSDSTIPNESKLRAIKRARTLYRKNDLTDLSPLGQVDSLALPGETYKLGFTSGWLSSVYRRPKAGQTAENLIPDASAVLGTIGPDAGGYVDLDGRGDWWIPSGRIYYALAPADTAASELTFAQQHFFLPRRYNDPFNRNVIVTYDTYDTLLIEIVDPLANKITAGERDSQGNVTSRNDYRVLQPSLVTNPNGTINEVLFDTLGRVVATAVHKGNQGDSLQSLAADDKFTLTNPTRKQLEDFSANPKAQAVAWLDAATACMIYDVDRYFLTGNPDKPPHVATIVRETHGSEPVAANGLKVQIGFSYSDGFGREIQKKFQAEPGLVGVVYADRRWIGSGWTVFNNKGKPISQFEPFFDDTHEFEFGNRVGVSRILFYDPMDRVVVTLHPDGNYEKAIFDPWHQETYDVNDTVMTDPRKDGDVAAYVAKYYASQPLSWKTWYQQREDGSLGPDQKGAADKAKEHADTPTVGYLDTLGRTYLTVAHNRMNGVDSYYQTRNEFDLEGNLREVTDAKNRVVMRYDYDMSGNRIRNASMEAGTQWMLNNVKGKIIRAWDSRFFDRRTTYDELQRPVGLFVTDNTGNTFLAQTIAYGESRPNAESTNHRLKVWQVRDGAGLFVNERYDFKGNITNSNRQLLKEYKTSVDWGLNPQLETETFTNSVLYDALNRPIQVVLPHSDSPVAKVNLVQPEYNEANLLARLEIWLGLDMATTVLLDAATATQRAVGNIGYNAKGQRELIEYGNNVSTSYQYDPFTFRLVHLETQRAADKLQDLSYTYDPAGNVVAIHDDSQETIFFSGNWVEPSTDLTYDAVYRLIKAAGREQLGRANGSLNPPAPTSYSDDPRVNLLYPGNGNELGTYSEEYSYDSVGNFETVKHQGANPANPGWTRTYSYEESSQIESSAKSNRLTSTSVLSVKEPYGYDEHGNMTTMPHLFLMQWDYRNTLQATSMQRVTNGGTPETTYYVYDSSGQRVRKVTELYAPKDETPRRKDERIYLGDFETYREYGGDGASVTLERETVHVTDNRRQIALIETRTQGDDSSSAQLIRYQFGNHLGSASLELDDKAIPISYEEYYPYGSTSYQSSDKSLRAAAKRYRYTGKERDEESGLYFYEARYYAPWIGRWTSVDPNGVEADNNLYAYVKGSPTRRLDSTGTQDSDPNEAISGAIDQLNQPGNPFQQQGKSGLKSTPLTMDIDEPKAVGQKDISPAEARARAMDVNNRQFLDPRTNRSTKFLGEDTNPLSPGQPPVSVSDNPSVLVTRRFSEVTEMRDVFKEALDKIKDPDKLSPTALKERINANMWDVIKNGTSESAAKVRGALGELGFENVKGQGYVMKAAESASAAVKESSLARAATWTAETAPKVLKVAGEVLTVYGAVSEANRTWQLEHSNNRGWLNEGLMWTSTAVVGVMAGAVDYALAAGVTAMSGSPAPVMDSWDQYGSGPVQHVAGEAIRGVLDWGAKHGL